MNKLLIPATSLLILVSSNLFAEDQERGQQLHGEHCIKCHGSEVYTRPNRRVGDLPGLHKQVRFCEQNLGLTWFDDDIDSTTTYLNQEYYKFDPKQ
ncbi:MAG: cytochrome c [Candidatus Thiodiazotropha sp. 6PLUC2]